MARAGRLMRNNPTVTIAPRDAAADISLPIARTTQAAAEHKRPSRQRTTRALA